MAALNCIYNIIERSDFMRKHVGIYCSSRIYDSRIFYCVNYVHNVA